MCEDVVAEAWRDDHAGHARMIEVLAACPHCPPFSKPALVGCARCGQALADDNCPDLCACATDPTAACAMPPAWSEIVKDDAAWRPDPAVTQRDSDGSIFPAAPGPRTPAPCSVSPPGPFPSDLARDVTHRDR